MNTPYTKSQFHNKYRRYFYNRMLPFVKSRRGSAYMMMTLSLFAVAFFGFFAVRPTVRTIVQLRKQIDDNRRVADVLQKKIDVLVEAQEEYQLVKDFVPALNEALPSSPSLANLLATIDRIAIVNEATISGLSVSEIKYDLETKKVTPETADKSLVDSIKLNLIVRGTYAQVAEFLQRLVNTRRIIKIDSLDIVSTAGVNGPLLELSLVINSYYKQ